MINILTFFSLVGSLSQEEIGRKARFLRSTTFESFSKNDGHARNKCIKFINLSETIECETGNAIRFATAPLVSRLSLCTLHFFCSFS